MRRGERHLPSVAASDLVVLPRLQLRPGLRYSPPVVRRMNEGQNPMRPLSVRRLVKGGDVSRDQAQRWAVDKGNDDLPRPQVRNHDAPRLAVPEHQVGVIQPDVGD